MASNIKEEKMCTMRDDIRPIRSVVGIGETGLYWAVGREGVTRIVPYGENGQGAEVPWLAIYEGDSITFRVNCAGVESISYDA